MMPTDLNDPHRNIIEAIDQMIAAIEDGRYEQEGRKIRSDLQYLRAEARRAELSYAPTAPLAIDVSAT